MLLLSSVFSQYMPWTRKPVRACARRSSVQCGVASFPNIWHGQAPLGLRAQLKTWPSVPGYAVFQMYLSLWYIVLLPPGTIKNKIVFVLMAVWRKKAGKGFSFPLSSYSWFTTPHGAEIVVLLHKAIVIPQIGRTKTVGGGDKRRNFRRCLFSPPQSRGSSTMSNVRQLACV